MKKFPRFLKTLPQIYGLSFYEIAGLVIALYVAMIFKFPPLMTLFLSVGVILLLKVLKKNFDFIGVLLPKTKKVDLSTFKGGGK
ncbi:MAG: hypothetical protein CME65_10280 [Halobacteriovoraceae bacterium]|nr:hypothetical protein [Halobacteriovoraceae bacterium]|tara:strand:- start:10105 stop:10356 length:252 start_codon:yes stop_codon:yes gene_type:complete